MSTMLVVDDEQSICWGLSRLGESIGHQVVTAASAEQALDLAADVSPDVVVLDVRLPGMDGLSAIEKLREQVGQVPIIVITAYGDLTTAVEAVRCGAFEYIIKPFDLQKVERALVRALVRRVPEDDRSQPPPHAGGLRGSSSAKRIALAAAADVSVLLSSESGTGKELAARAIHTYSDRAEGPFVAVNVASLSSSLAESELFGHSRGAFTGADQERTGLLVQADGGTLFLDEVADIPLPTQVKLLRALEYGEVTPVGSSRSVPTNFRVISASHQDLQERVQEGAFRHDLFFRLGAFRIDIPPLRERSEDIGELAEHFLHQAVRGEATDVAFSPAALREMESRPWYGNARELRHAVQHALTVARRGVIEPEHLPPPAEASCTDASEPVAVDAEALAALVRRWAAGQFSEEPPGQNDEGDIYQRLLQVIEPPLLEEALRHSRGQYSAAARRLGLHRTTLRKKMDEYAVEEE